MITSAPGVGLLTRRSKVTAIVVNSFLLWKVLLSNPFSRKYTQAFSGIVSNPGLLRGYKSPCEHPFATRIHCDRCGMESSEK